MSSETKNVVIRAFGLVHYETTWHAMQKFTEARAQGTPDQLWLVEHTPVFTMGLKGRGGSVTDIRGIPLVYSDRGGDMTYHGPGQVVLYPLLDLHRLGIGIKSLVNKLEQAVIDYLDEFDIEAGRHPGAPGVYVGGRKIAALGLRVRNGCTYHGLSFNVDMALEPFTYIDPCGYEGLEVTQLTEFHPAATPDAVAAALAQRLASLLGYNDIVNQPSSDPATLASLLNE